jgi:hypothetical protein
LLEVRDPIAAKAAITEAIDARIALLEAADARYPHAPLLIAILFEWYQMKVDFAQSPDERKRWVLKSLACAEEGVRRSPKEYWFRGLLGRALFQRAAIEPNPTLAVETLRRGLDQYREATALFGTSQDMYAQYGEALEKCGAAFKRAGDPGTGDTMIAEGQKAKAYAKKIKEFKEQTHTGATG